MIPFMTCMNHTTLWTAYDFNVMIVKYGIFNDLTVAIHRHIWLSMTSMYLYSSPKLYWYFSEFLFFDQKNSQKVLEHSIFL